MISAASLIHVDSLGRLRRWKERLNAGRGIYVSSSGESFYPEELITPPESLAPYVPTPTDVVEKMLELAELKPGEIIYDLGSGDGRIIHTAAKRFKAKGVGIEIHGNLIEQSRKTAEEIGVSDTAQFIRGNLLDVDLSQADVVTVYLLTPSNERIREKLEHELSDEARVVTHDFPISRWTPSNKASFVGESGKHILYLYRVHRS